MSKQPRTRARRLTRRTFGVLLGLILGWYVAGVVGQPGVLVDSSYAQPVHHDEAPVAHEDHDHTPAGTNHADHHGDDHANPAANLVPHESLPWFRPVLLTAGGLFLAALLIGPLALKLRGPLPPDPADNHDDHAHDDHGHAAQPHGGGHH